ncbi:MAG: AAA family ATPase [Planctomycetota bacterium]|nr:AAA family ATPase [Planctomycetota bacterium]
MNSTEITRLLGLLRRVLRDCSMLYERCGKWMVRRYPNLIEGDTQEFLELMDDLHRGLIIKVYVDIVRADDRWSATEKQIAAEMIQHLWGNQLRGAELREAATALFSQADALTWESLVAPFVRYPPLEDSKTQVETIAMRLGNLVAKCDGVLRPEEETALHTMQQAIDMALRPAHPDQVLAPLSGEKEAQSAQAQQQEQQEEAPPPPRNSSETDLTREERLSQALKELDELIGLDSVKERVKSYTNFLKLQEQRKQAGLTTMPISLHMSFVGNPGTGKTTVARILGQILGALGTLSNGHVVETDRSGLVAEYAGQTGPKTNKLCDSALNGVLFIDEAYSLIDTSGEDAYGREAVQSLLKRMEDNRDQLAVILAGYEKEMESLIRSNPGLSSRVNTTIVFEDYSPTDLGKIFEVLCNQNQYELLGEARYLLLVGFSYLYQKRDRHFGNGRLARNTFEDSVRKLADRIARSSELTEALLTRLSAEDISIPGISKELLIKLADQAPLPHVLCTACKGRIRIQPRSLGCRIKCPKCEEIQVHPWASLAEDEAAC